MNGGNYRSSDSEHQSDSGGNHKEWCRDIDGCQCIAANSFPYEYSVCDDEYSRENHSEYCRNQ